MDGRGAADSRGRRCLLLLRVSHLLPDHPQVRLAEDRPCSRRRGHRRAAAGLRGPRHGAVGHPPPRSRRGTLVRQAEEVNVMLHILEAVHHHHLCVLASSAGTVNKKKKKNKEKEKKSTE